MSGLFNAAADAIMHRKHRFTPHFLKQPAAAPGNEVNERLFVSRQHPILPHFRFLRINAHYLLYTKILSQTAHLCKLSSSLKKKIQNSENRILLKNIVRSEFVFYCEIFQQSSCILCFPAYSPRSFASRQPEKQATER